MLTTAYKSFANVLSRDCNSSQKTLLDNTGQSTINQIESNRQILDKTLEYNKDTHHLFVDFKAACDSVIRTARYKANFGMPHKQIKLTKLTMQIVRPCVRIQGEK